MQHSVEYICFMPHKGEILERAVRKTAISISELARKVDYDRGTIYRHFKDEDLEDSIILKYSKALKNDFRKEFPQLPSYGNLLQEPLNEYRALTLSEALQEADMWKEKYISLLEQYNNLLKKMVDEDK